MLNRFPLWPIRRLMIVLLFCLAIPCLLLVVYSGIEARDEAITVYQKAILRIVNTIASEQQAVVAGVEQLVTALALLPQVKSCDRRATDAILSELLKKESPLCQYRCRRQGRPYLGLGCALRGECVGG